MNGHTQVHQRHLGSELCSQDSTSASLSSHTLSSHVPTSSALLWVLTQVLACSRGLSCGSSRTIPFSLMLSLNLLYHSFAIFIYFYLYHHLSCSEMIIYLSHNFMFFQGKDVPSRTMCKRKSICLVFKWHVASGLFIWMKEKKSSGTFTFWQGLF